ARRGLGGRGADHGRVDGPLGGGGSAGVSSWAAATSWCEHLDAGADELDGRPRKTLGWETPAERLHEALAA
ncbi:hypothetical protein, partial [Streptomyces sp. NPDC014791]|uniref:hypothetical protein n=1 Tax=Streptomyces sp. NPDC014791 TaxID=3364912 RepID=UPI0036FF3DE1